RDWFAAQDFKGRLFRLSTGFAYKNSLGKIPDVNWNFFEDFVKKSSGHSLLPQISFRKFSMEKEARLKLIEKTLKENKGSAEWIREALPSLYIRDSRSGKDLLSNEIKEKMESFIENVSRAAFPGGKES
ncbi:MAG: hypothetical protein IKN90_05775, partial [Treponema sp.]|nr:hypothetical protein [Treponema sp.]